MEQESLEEKLKGIFHNEELPKEKPKLREIPVVLTSEGNFKSACNLNSLIKRKHTEEHEKSTYELPSVKDITARLKEHKELEIAQEKERNEKLGIIPNYEYVWDDDSQTYTQHYFPEPFATEQSVLEIQEILEGTDWDSLP